VQDQLLERRSALRHHQQADGRAARNERLLDRPAAGDKLLVGRQVIRRRQGRPAVRGAGPEIPWPRVWGPAGSAVPATVERWARASARTAARTAAIRWPITVRLASATRGPTGELPLTRGTARTPLGSPLVGGPGAVGWRTILPRPGSLAGWSPLPRSSWAGLGQSAAKRWSTARADVTRSVTARPRRARTRDVRARAVRARATTPLSAWTRADRSWPARTEPAGLGRITPRPTSRTTTPGPSPMRAAAVLPSAPLLVIGRTVSHD
jgi:hypothetical protein